MFNDYESRKSKGRKKQERKHSFADALKALPNDKFITPEFQRNHIHRGSPSPEEAELEYEDFSEVDEDSV